jgi:hypothetical protein
MIQKMTISMEPYIRLPKQLPHHFPALRRFHWLAIFQCIHLGDCVDDRHLI